MCQPWAAQWGQGEEGGAPLSIRSLGAQVLTRRQAAGISHHLQLQSAKANFSMSVWRSQRSLPVSNLTHKMGVLKPRELGPDYPHNCSVMGQELHLGKQQNKPELPTSPSILLINRAATQREVNNCPWRDICLRRERPAKFIPKLFPEVLILFKRYPGGLERWLGWASW